MSTQYAMVATISTHARPTVHQRHNRRDPAVVQAEDHIDPHGVHEEGLDVDELDAYREIFGTPWNVTMSVSSEKIASLQWMAILRT